jgi:PBSX family phage terminase large subunit
VEQVVRIEPPNEKQKAFLSDTHRHCAYGGARGGGKSWAVRVKAVLLAGEWPGIKILIIRKTYRELINNHIVPLQAMLPRSLARYNKADKVFTFKNGSTIWFGYCANDGDLDQYQGAEYDVIFIDEATQLKEEWIKKINLAVRQPNGLPKRTYYTCNPGGVGHQYIKRLFIDRRYENNEIPENYSFTQARVVDNHALMEQNPEYLAELEALPPKLREAWLNGSWDIFDGQFFEEFRDDPEHYEDRLWTHIIEPFNIPDSWTIYRSFDWGYAKPFSCGWWAIDHDGVAYRILELYGCTKTPNEGLKWTPDKVFSEIHRIETEHPWLKGKRIQGVADPAIWDAESGESIAEVAARHFVHFSKADNKRLAGWMQVHYRMAFDENGYPMMYIFNTCKGFIRTIPLLQYDEHKVEDLDTDSEDHIADECRYFCMARPIKPRAAVKRDPYLDNPAYTVLGIEKLPKATVRQRMQIIGGEDDE